jgi:hypothetical protein
MRTRKFVLIAFVAFIVLSVKPATVLAFDPNPPTGNPIQDAPTLQADIKAFTDANAAGKAAAESTILNFFTAYFPPGQAPQDIAHLQAAVADNAYLTQELAPLFGRAPAGGTITAFTIASGPSQAGNLFSGANLEDVLATFIASRFKQELEMAFLDKMKTWLEGDGIKYKPLLPNTYVVLDQNDPFNYSTFFESLKEALEKDIRALPNDAGTFLAADPFGLAGGHPQYYNILVLYETMVQIAQGQNAFQTLAAINSNPLINQAGAEPIANGVLRLTGILARLLINPTNSSATVLLTSQAIANDLATTDEKTNFVGLLLLLEKGEFQHIHFTANDLYTSINGANTVAQMTTFITWLNSASAAYQSASATVAQVIQNQKGFKNITGQMVGSLLTSTESILTSIQTFPFAPRGFFPAATYQAIDGQLKDLSKIAADMADSNYGLAFTDLISYIKTDIEPLLQADDQKTLNILLPIIQQYGGFAVSVAKAKSNADLESALESAALPVGSYRIKRTTYKNISLNAWAGVFGGWQTYPGSVPTSVNTNNFAYGFTVPIGVAYSWGEIATEDNNDRKIKKGDLNGNSNTLFLSIIDLGAITAFRAFHDSTATLPDFKWQNTLAPGLFFVHGFRQSPLSFGGGIQYGPQLRSVTNNVAVTLPSALTVRLFLAVDIPLLNFYTRTTPNN